ncbi:hypothetical protein A35_0060 (plasmid) [Coxiella burnetii 'MSU Goat Q177']|nr:hypothetical protein A35_0060 [Coxiella burnetii 'MSU Goat Q177']
MLPHSQRESARPIDAKHPRKRLEGKRGYVFTHRLVLITR